MKTNTSVCLVAFFCVGAPAIGALLPASDPSMPEANSAPPPSSSSSQPDKDGWRISIYPILVWAPVMGADVRVPNLPPFPDLPGGGTGGGSASGGLAGTIMSGLSLEKNKWRVDVNGLWAALSAERTARPNLKVDLDILFGDIVGGRKIAKDIYAVGGVRRMSLSYGIKIADLPEFSRKPGVWDPLVGIGWHHDLGRKWTMHATALGGGFGVGSDVDISMTARAEWRFAKHFGLTFGYGFLYFKISDTVRDATFTAKQTLNGPILGFGIYF